MQVLIHPDYRPKVALHTHTLKLGYTCMPLQFMNTPAKLQHQANNDFLGLINEGRTVIYKEDALVSRWNVQESLQRLTKALKLL